MDSGDVEEAVTEMVRVLGGLIDRDWRRRAGSLDWSCWTTAVHVAHDLLAYAAQLAACPATGYLPIDLVVRPATPPAQVLQVITACGGLLSSALTTADPAVRAWHWGPTDPGGFAALGVNEVLVHGYDITQGLGIRWLPPMRLCAAVLARLFPDAPTGDPRRVLLWSTGRVELDGRPRRTSWIVKAALD